MSKFLVKKKFKSQIKTTSLNNRKEINIKTPKYHISLHFYWPQQDRDSKLGP